VGSLEPDFMKRLCTALGLEELANLGLSPQPAQQKRLKDALKVEFEKHDFAELCARFAGLDACVEPVLSLSEAVQHPQMQARELVTEVPRGDGTSQLQMACPLKFSQGLPQPGHIGATLGQHTDQVLDELGYSVERIAELRRAKVVL